MRASAILFGVIVVLALGAGARAAVDDPGPGLPTGLCKAWACSPVHRDVWRRFETGAAVDDVPLPMMYSGICWMFGPGFDPHRRHHVGMLIDHFENGVAMGLQFSFFSKRQPFVEVDRVAARRLFDGSPMPVVYGAGYAFAEAARVQPFRYWVRLDGDDPEKLAMLGYFGFRYTLLCSLRDNASYR